MDVVRHTRTAAIKEAALELGFDAVGVAAAGPADDGEHFQRWLNAGYAAGMDYMHRTAAVRRDPRLYVPDAKSIVVVALSYFHPEGTPSEPLKVSRYCQGADYHSLIKKRVRRLRRVILDLDPDGFAAPTVDTSPVLERYWAHQAGIAWTGKSTMAISRSLGTYTFLGCVVTTLDLEPDAPHRDHCGSCTRCLDACPTGAFVGPRSLDAGRCITYWNIEHRAPYPAEGPDLHGWVAGCDVCQEVCPWNKFARTTREPRFAPRRALNRPDVETWTAPAHDQRLQDLLTGTAIKRTGSHHLRRSARRILGLPPEPTATDTATAR